MIKTNAQPILQPQKELEPKRLTILGSTGSIGQTTLKLIAQHPERFAVEALSAENNVELLAFQARQVGAKRAVIGNEKKYAEIKNLLSGSFIEATYGKSAIMEAARLPVDMLISGIIGFAGLSPVFAAAEQGATIALATKECLVAAGTLLSECCKASGASLLPIDSEHNAVFQLLDGRSDVAHVTRIVLTASGGPFRGFSAEQLRSVTPAQAVKHPNWSMGAKISVDSATLMNKGLELIEAYHLFPAAQQALEVLVHPESIVHCLVYYRDGAVYAQLSAPDMSVPISYCLSYPDRMASLAEPLDLAKIGALHFEAPDERRFPCLRLAKEAMAAGGTAPCVLNAANEVAVAAFLEGRLGFTDIPRVIEQTLSAICEPAPSTLAGIEALDALARTRAIEYIASIKG